MDGLALQQSLMASLVNGLKTLAEERRTSTSPFHYAEVVGRMDTMQTVLEYLRSADISPCDNCASVKDGAKKGCAKCNGVCQGHPDTGENPPKRKRSG